MTATVAHGPGVLRLHDGQWAERHALCWITSDLPRRAYEHRQGLVPGFTADYGVKTLVWYEQYPTADEAIAAEKRIKRWRRKWKLARIEQANPQWLDLYETLA
jgi:putative endonuclease